MQDQTVQPKSDMPTVIETHTSSASEPVHLPVPVRHNGRRRVSWMAMAFLVVALSCVGGGGYLIWQRLHPPLPAGISFGNGRIEADEVDIDTKYAGRVAELMADIGDLVTAG